MSPYPDQEGNKLGSMSGKSAIWTISRRELSSSFFFPPQGKAPIEIHAILTETLACFFPVLVKDISAHLYVCVCMCVCVYVCIYVCMYVSIYVRAFVCTCVYMYICMYLCIYGCVYVYTDVCTYVHMHVCMHAHKLYPCCYMTAIFLIRTFDIII